MKEVHYFQRFSKKEDVATNNTLLLFERLQHQNAWFFQQILRALISDDDLVVGAHLTQQEKTTSGTIADGVIHQRSFHIVLETKRHASFDVKQLEGHLAAFESSKEGLEVLLLLGTQEPDDLPAAKQAVADFNAKRKKSVRLAWTTFANVIDKCRDVLPEHERMMVEILDDYEDFCNEEGLISKSDADFLVVGCSQSLQENIEFRLYYTPYRSHRPAKYIGFYDNKAVRAIGVLEKVVHVERTESGLHAVEGGALTQEQQTRIDGSMDSASKRGWDITHGHFFFLAGAVELTLFQKQTKYPLWSRRYFDLREVLALDASVKLPELSSLAQALRSRTW
jgi:hypothetical protein